MDIQLFHRRRLSYREIAEKLGISRNTVAKYIHNPTRAVAGPAYPRRASQLDPSAANIKAWIEEDFEYKATWIYDQLVKIGFSDRQLRDCQSKVRELKQERQQIAYMRFETEPGYQSSPG